MLSELTGAQMALLLSVQRAWVKEMVEIGSRWKVGRIVKETRNMLSGGVARSETFVCEHCKRQVSAVAPGAQLRTHCPHCLWSLHTDSGESGGHADRCNGHMEPVAVLLEPQAWSLIHQCRQCEATQTHAIAVDDNAAALLAIAGRRTAQPVTSLSGAGEA